MSIVAIDSDFFSVWPHVKEALENGPASLMTIYARQASRPHDFDAHVHDVPTIVYCIAGTARIRYFSGCVDLLAGDAAAIVPGAWHSHDPPRPGCVMYGQGISRSFSDALIQAHGKSWSLFLPISPSRQILFSIISSRDNCRQISLAKELFMHGGNGSRIPMTVKAPVQNMADFLWRNLNRPITASDILLSSGVGMRHAHRLFLDHYGMTPKKRILSAHLALARQYLNEGLSISEAAFASGFASRADLTRAWKRAHGASPRTIRH